MTRILEVDETGSLTLPSDVLKDAGPHTRYIMETNGARITLRPEAPKQNARTRKNQTSLEKWEKDRQKLTEELGKVWPEGVSVVDVISEMRR